jgi:hypothetical protein
MNTAIKGVVPHPGATFPYSEFNGFSKVPRLVTTLLFIPLLLRGTFEVAIKERRTKNYQRKLVNLRALQKDRAVLSQVVQSQYKQSRQLPLVGGTTRRLERKAKNFP